MILAASAIKPADWLVVVVYFASIIGMGAYFARRQRSTNEYFLGSRSMAPWVVGLSIIASLLSTISYLANPGEMIKHGPGILFNLLCFPLAFVVIAYVVIPFFMRLPITSAYEYLEARFGSETRTLGALLFIVIRILWMSVVVYTAGKAMAAMTDSPIWAVILAVGVFTTFYAALGGIRAVIWTDVIQFVILLGGAVFAVGYVTWDMGFSNWISVAYRETRLEAPIWSWDPRVRVTIIGICLHYFAWRVCTYGSDQVVIQRYLTTRDAPSARRSFIVCCIGSVVLSVVLASVGFALLAFFTYHPELLTGELAGKLREEADGVFPFFIANQLPVGLTGLITAALFAAAMSSLDSGVNSVSTVITVDFYQRRRRKPTTDKTSLWFAKLLGLALGLTATVLALFVGNIEGNIVEVTNKSTSCVVGPLFGLFALGMFTRRTNQFGAISGPVIGFLIGLVLTFSGQWFGREYGVSFTWLILPPVIVTLVAGYLLSLIRPAPAAERLRFTRRAVMSGDPPEFTAKVGPEPSPVVEAPEE